MKAGDYIIISKTYIIPAFTVQFDSVIENRNPGKKIDL